MKKPCIGILAGMGPRSTAPFIDMLIDECVAQYGAKYDADFPAMLVYSLPAPFYPDRPVDHDALRGAIHSGLCELAGFGVDFIAMPCNVAHVYYDELKRCVNIPLLNIVDETVARVPRKNKGVALLAAGATLASGIYQHGIAQGGKKLVYAPDVDKLIMDLKRDGINKTNIEAMAKLLAEAKRADADCAVIGCTDLTPLASACEAEIDIIDSAACLAKAAVALYVRLKSDFR